MTRTARILGSTVLTAALLSPTVATADVRHDAAAAGRAEVFRVKMLDRDRNVFRPGVLTISRGDVVKWKNRGDLTHTSTGSNWDSGSVSPGETFRRRFRRAGTFNYRCSIHPEMTGTVVVE